ncbi:hypothetical protein F5051DRAFT_414863 [Lentinula edodes]|nr:hypothetical protein F5051DRAFT_414863 [Lentinula edodes]
MTDKPNSHTFMLVMADGMVKGAGNYMTTPDICLTMFDEWMTTLEYEFFNSNMIWRVTGVSPNRYELVLCVDADVFPDSLTRMVSCTVTLWRT